MFFPSRVHATKISRLLLLVGVMSPVVQAQLKELSLPEAERIALTQDAGSRSLISQARALSEQAVVADSWPDPKLSIGTMNLPGDDLDPFNRGMVELKVEQMLPKGDSNKIQYRKMALQSEAREAEAENRRLRVLESVRLAWLDIWYWQQVINQMKQDRNLFDSLVEVTESLYSQGKKQQQDLYRVEVELTRLDDRIVSATASKEQSKAQLLRWLGNQSVDVITNKLPQFAPLPQDSQSRLLQHPLVIAAEFNVQQAEQDVALADESYKPQFGVELKYAREQMSMGESSRNKFSAMLMMDIPLFTGNRQDRQLAASQYRREASIAQRLDVLEQLRGQLNTEKARYVGLLERTKLFRKQLLPQINNQANAALRAYQSDAGDFNDVVQAYKARLTSTLEYFRLQADSRQSAARLQHLVPTSQDLQQADQGVTL